MTGPIKSVNVAGPGSDTTGRPIYEPAIRAIFTQCLAALYKAAKEANQEPINPGEAFHPHTNTTIYHNEVVLQKSVNLFLEGLRTHKMAEWARVSDRRHAHEPEMMNVQLSEFPRMFKNLVPEQVDRALMTCRTCNITDRANIMISFVRQGTTCYAPIDVAGYCSHCLSEWLHVSIITKVALNKVQNKEQLKRSDFTWNISTEDVNPCPTELAILPGLVDISASIYPYKEWNLTAEMANGLWLDLTNETVANQRMAAMKVAAARRQDGAIGDMLTRTLPQPIPQGSMWDRLALAWRRSFKAAKGKKAPKKAVATTPAAPVSRAPTHQASTHQEPVSRAPTYQEPVHRQRSGLQGPRQ